MEFQVRKLQGLCSVEAYQERREAHLTRIEGLGGKWQTAKTDCFASGATTLGPM